MGTGVSVPSVDEVSISCDARREDNRRFAKAFFAVEDSMFSEDDAASRT